MKKATFKLGQKRPNMHGVNFLSSKCLECKRNITIQPEAKYVNLPLVTPPPPLSFPAGNLPWSFP